MKLIGGKTVRSKFLNAIGISETEARAKDSPVGPLDELRASSLLSGPFKIDLTKKPLEHLTFTGSHAQLFVRILDLETIFKLYTPQRSGLARLTSDPKSG